MAMVLGLAGLASTNASAQSKTFVFRSVVQGLKPSIGLSVSPSTVLFGTVALGQSASANIVITNTGGTSLSGLQYSASTNFSVSGSCPTTLAAGEACTESLTYTPSATQTQTGTFTASDSLASAQSTLSGTGATPSYSLSTSSVTFPVVYEGGSTTQTLTLTNTSVVSGTPSLSASTNFASTQCGTLAPGGQCTVTLTFTSPTSLPYSMPYSGTLTVTNGTVGTQTVALSGTGAVDAMGNYSVTAPYNAIYSPDLTWHVAMQSDCSLVTVHNGTVVWSSGSSGKGTGCWLAMQGDGNLVIYNQGSGVASNSVWSIQTGGKANGPTFMEIDNTGLFSVYSGTPSSPGTLIWQN
jgi:hypothetical protein